VKILHRPLLYKLSCVLLIIYFFLIIHAYTLEPSCPFGAHTGYRDCDLSVLKGLTVGHEGLSELALLS